MKISNLSKQEKQKFSAIIFHDNSPHAFAEIDQLSEEEKAKIKKVFDQKLAFEQVYKPINPPPAPAMAGERPNVPSLISTICCCFYPEQNRDVLDVTNDIFLKRMLGVFLFWKKNFLAVGGNKIQFYGPIWITLTYIVVMGLAANLNVYFIDPTQFEFSQTSYLQIIGICIIFFMVELILYPAMIKCLGGFISNDQSTILLGYSLMLYIIPTLLCIFPTILWHFTALGGAGFLRTIFLFRNYSAKVQSKSFIILIIVGVIQTLYMYIIIQSMFSQNSGYTFQDGIALVTNTNSSTTAHMLFLRNFFY